MVFNSLAFLVFFPLVTALFFLLPHKYRWALLLTASCFFYMYFKPVYILIILFTIIIDYFAGILISNAHGRKRKWYLALSIVANVGVLAIFKYYNFINFNVDVLGNLFHFKNPIPALDTSKSNCGLKPVWLVQYPMYKPGNPHRLFPAESIRMQ